MKSYVTTALAAVALIAAGCGGGGGGKTTSVDTRGYSTTGPQLSKTDYAHRLQSIVAGDLKAAQTKLAAAGESNPDAGSQAAETFRKAANEIAALNPPTALQDANKRLVNAIAAFADQLDKLVKATKDKDEGAAKEVIQAMPGIERQLQAAQASALRGAAGG
jgi:hypothetical protein